MNKILVLPSLFAFIFANGFSCTNSIAKLDAAIESSENLDNNSNLVLNLNSRSFIQGDYFICDVSIPTLNNVASLSLELHYNEGVFDSLNFNNCVNSKTVDYKFDSGSLNVAYLFNENEIPSLSTLFSISGKIKNEAKIGSYTLDLLVKDAYNFSLNLIELKGNTTSFKIIENDTPEQHKTAYFYQSFDTVNTKVEKTFSNTYSTYNSSDIASGAFCIKYDAELFEFVSIKKLDALNNKIVDINDSIKGSINIAFVGTDENRANDLFEITFKTLANVDANSQILFEINDLFSFDHTPITTRKIITNVCISYDDSYATNLPKVYLSGIIDNHDKSLIITVSIDENSSLGAGDFEIHYDKTLLNFASFKKKYLDGSILVNSTKAKEGILQFSVVDTNGITKACELVSFNFNYENVCQNTNCKIELTGELISDELTNLIRLNLIGCDVNLPANHSYGDYVILEEPTYIKDGKKVKTCKKCGKKEEVTIPKLLNDNDYSQALSYATNFIKTNVCGTDDYTIAISDLFLKQRDDFNALNDNVRIALSNTKASASSENLIQNCLAKYDRIIALHGFDKIAYPDFMNRMDNKDVLETNALNFETIQISDVKSTFITIGVILILCITLIPLCLIKIFDKREK